MMTCQVTNPMVPMSDMTVRHESMTDLAQEREKSKVSRLPFILPSTMKSVEVESLNRIYKGMGIRNVNGGMVFYSDNIHDKRKSTYEESLMSLREQLEQLAHERALTIATIANGRKNIHKWNSLIEEKHHALLSNEAVMRDLISQQRIGLVTEEEKTERRKAIFSDNRRIENEIQRVEQLIKDYDLAINRIRILEQCIIEVDAKFCDKNRECDVMCTTTIDRPGYLIFPLTKDMSSKECILFMEFFDYLSYMHLTGDDDTSTVFPRHCDCYVMNDVRNFISTMLDTEHYDKIYCFFPDTVLGRTMEQTLLQRNPEHVVSGFKYYKGYISLYDMVCGQNRVEEEKPYIYPVFI